MIRRYRPGVHWRGVLGEPSGPVAAADVGVAVLVSVADLATFWGLSTADPALQPGWTPLVLLLLASPLALRRRHPFAVFALVGCATAALAVLGWLVTLFALLAAVYALAAHATVVQRRVGAVGLVLGLLAVNVAVSDLQALPAESAMYATAWALGALSRTRSVYTAAVEERARVAEQARDDRARLAVATERTRIAHELHDVVAHSLSVIVVQAAAARSALPEHTDDAGTALAHVEGTARDSIARCAGCSVRCDRTKAPAPRAPHPGLQRIDELLDRFRATGLEVTLQVEGEPRPVSDVVSLSAYRVVQEALTNTLRHAGPDEAHVTLRWTSAELEVRVENAGPAPRTSRRQLRDHGSGLGLMGIRDRVTLLGGRMRAAPTPARGFLLDVHLPLRDAP